MDLRGHLVLIRMLSKNRMKIYKILPKSSAQLLTITISLFFVMQAFLKCANFIELTYPIYPRIWVVSSSQSLSLSEILVFALSSKTQFESPHTTSHTVVPWTKCDLRFNFENKITSFTLTATGIKLGSN